MGRKKCEAGAGWVTVFKDGCSDGFKGKCEFGFVSPRETSEMAGRMGRFYNPALSQQYLNSILRFLLFRLCQLVEDGGGGIVDSHPVFPLNTVNKPKCHCSPKEYQWQLTTISCNFTKLSTSDHPMFCIFPERSKSAFSRLPRPLNAAMFFVSLCGTHGQDRESGKGLNVGFIDFHS